MASGCTYGYGQTRGGRKPAYTYDGVGWDGELAYGDAMTKATVNRNGIETPDYVSMNCLMYGIKALAAGAAGALVGWAATESKPEIALGASVGALAIALVPNCFTTIGYDEPRADRRQSVPGRPVVRPSLRTDPMRLKTPTSSSDQESEDEATETAPTPPPPPPPPTAPNQARDRERPSDE
jgi:hypothetical protein